MQKQLMRLIILVIMPLAVAQGQEFYEGDTVRTSDDSVGTVKQIFSNGIVRVQIGKGASEQGVFEYTLNQLSLQECSRIGGANCRQ
jgi:hypothetical protein